MVFPGGKNELERAVDMEAVHNDCEHRSFKAPLHNFNLSPFLNWGNQRQLRCMKLPGIYDTRNQSSPPRQRLKRSPAMAIGDEGIEAVREKIMFDLKTAAERLKVAIFKEEETSSEDREEESVKRWNLRARKGSVADPPSLASGLECSTENQKRKKFSVSLSKKEIEEDYVGIFGHRPPRRPKKRPRIVQRQLDVCCRRLNSADFGLTSLHLQALFPGLWLTEVSVEIYKVPESLPEKGPGELIAVKR